MSYCSDVKNELLGLRMSGCCRSAYVYGFMLFGRAFSVKRIALQTSNEAVANGYKEAICSLYGILASIKAGGNIRPTFVAEVKSESDRLKILASFDFGVAENIIDRSVFLRECCFGAFLRGAFLACGNINDPEKEYRIEFNIKNKTAALELKELLKPHGINLSFAEYSGFYKLYTKDSTVIEDTLTLMGASHTTLAIIDTKIMKGVKNDTNRARNCDNANISKTVEASIKQRTAIEHLEKTDRLLSLPPELLYAARLRQNNPDATLKELCRIADEPLTVSGLNHRLCKIVEIYENIKLSN